MSARKILSVLSIFALTLSGCGNSPLFNHDDADDLDQRPATAPAPTCALSFPNAGLCAAIEWTNGPNQEESSFNLRFWSLAQGAGVPVDPPLEVAVKLWMPDMGHGSSPVTIVRTDVGTFAVSRVFFIMPGAWDLRIQLKNAAVVSEQAVARVDIR